MGTHASTATPHSGSRLAVGTSAHGQTRHLGSRDDSTDDLDRRLSRRFPVDPVGILAVLTLVGLALRVIGLNSQLWYDEIYSLVVSSRPPLREILTTYYGDIQHPLYSVLANVSIAALGETAWTVRLPAVIFGVASIPLLFLLGRAVATTREALLAAAFLTVSYHHVWFSQNARGYTALLFWTLLCTLLFYRGLELRRWPPFLGYAVAAALGAYTHLTFVFVVVGHAAVVLLLAARSFREGREGRRWLAMPIAAIVLSGVLTLALYAPILGQVIALLPPQLRQNEGGLDSGMGPAGDPARARSSGSAPNWCWWRRRCLSVAGSGATGKRIGWRSSSWSFRRSSTGLGVVVMRGQDVPALPVPAGRLRDPDRGAGGDGAGGLAGEARQSLP